MKQRFSKLHEEMIKRETRIPDNIDHQQNDLFREVLINDMMTREAIASIALDHDPQYQTMICKPDAYDEYEKCSIIELPDLGAVFIVDGEEEGGFIQGALGIVDHDNTTNMVAKLAFYVSEGMLHVRFLWKDEDVQQFFSTNERFVVWA